VEVIVKFLVASLLLITPCGIVHAQQHTTYPLNCRAGKELSMSIKNRSSGPMLVGTFQHASQARIPNPGSCTWDDRPLGPSEPSRFCMPIQASDLQRNGTARLIGALGSTNGTARLLVYNNGAGCMDVTHVLSAVTPRKRRQQISINDIQSRLSQRPRGGKSEDLVSPDSLPRPPRGDEAASRLQAHSRALLSIVKALLDKGTLAQYLNDERTRCGDEVFCLMDLRQTAIAVAVEGR
jgi:hypothetical protein